VRVYIGRGEWSVRQAEAKGANRAKYANYTRTDLPRRQRPPINASQAEALALSPAQSGNHQNPHSSFPLGNFVSLEILHQLDNHKLPHQAQDIHLFAFLYLSSQVSRPDNKKSFTMAPTAVR
jgi:hypothetical protein